MSCQYIFIFALHFNVELIKMFKYVGHICKFLNPTMMFIQMVVVVT